MCTFSYQHLRDHVVWDFILIKLFGHKAVAVALWHSTCPTWQREERVQSVEGQKWEVHFWAVGILYPDAGCSWFWMPRWGAETDSWYLDRRPCDGPGRNQSLWWQIKCSNHILDIIVIDHTFSQYINPSWGQEHSPYLTSGTVTELSAMLVERMTCKDEEIIGLALTRNT